MTGGPRRLVAAGASKARRRLVAATACGVGLAALLLPPVLDDDGRGGSGLPAESWGPTAATTRAGAVLVSGRGADGQRGDGSRTDSMVYRPVAGLPDGPLPPAVAVAGGDAHSLAVLADGRVAAWGANHLGQLGDGGRTSRTTPGFVFGTDGRPLRDVVAVATDSELSMALQRDGTVVTWGPNDAGQRGAGTEDPVAGTTVVRGLGGAGSLRGVVAIAADGRTELALLSDGRVAAWGANDFGQLGDGTREDRTAPVLVRAPGGVGQLDDIVAIAVGGQHALAVRGNGSVVAWGRNDLGQLGDDTTVNRPFPVTVRGVDRQGLLGGAVEVAAGEKHSLARLADGTVVGWGNNTAGQLGDRTNRPRPYPSFVAGSAGAPVLTGVAAIAAGEAYGAAVTRDGRLLTWGANGAGQLGAAVRGARTEPVPAVGPGGRPLRSVIAVGGALRHALAVVGTDGLVADPTVRTRDGGHQGRKQ